MSFKENTNRYEEVKVMKKGIYFLIMVFSVVVLLSCPVYFSIAQENYPTRPIEVIVPWPPGGGADLLTRFFADKWAEFLGQPVVAVNKPGGGGLIGATVAANAKPDGYTLLMGSDGSLIFPRLRRKDVGFDLNSFRYIFLLSNNPTWFSVRADSKWKNMKEFLLDAKQNPGKLKYAALMGVSAHYAAEMLWGAAGVKVAFVPHKSSPASLTAVVGGHVDLASTSVLGGMKGSPLIRQLAVAERKRVFDSPEVPTLAELGYPIFIDTSVSLCGPKGISDEVIKKFTDAHLKVLKKYDKEIKERLPQIGNYPNFLEGESTMSFFREKEEKYREFAPKMGIKLE
jgi:tripartite-type tricarboxylate transporter receptor subunit TctC